RINRKRVSTTSPASMRPRQLRRGNKAEAKQRGWTHERFNEAAATSPRKPPWRNLKDDRPPGFNEAAATSPRKPTADKGFAIAAIAGFNEAAATSPRKRQAGA